MWRRSEKDQPLNNHSLEWRPHVVYTLTFFLVGPLEADDDSVAADMVDVVEAVEAVDKVVAERTGVLPGGVPER